MVKCIYEQEVLIKLLKKVENYNEYAKEIIKRCYVHHQIKEIKIEDELIYIKFQYLLPAFSQYPEGVFKFHFPDELEIISLKQKQIYMEDIPNYFKHMAERLSKGEKPEEYVEFKRRLEEGEDLD